MQENVKASQHAPSYGTSMRLLGRLPKVRFHCPKNLHIAVLGRQYNDLRIGKFCPNRNDRIEAVHLRHLQVHQCDVRTMRTELLNRLTPIRGFRYKSQSGLTTDEYSYALSYENMIVNRENPDWS
jgi:hypothetical protein